MFPNTSVPEAQDRAAQSRARTATAALWLRDTLGLPARLTLCALLAMAALVVAANGAAAQTVNACGPLENPYGPYDYRGDKKNWGTVDVHHFTPKVEALVRGMSGTVGQDIDYTLRVAPNHHRALFAVMGWGEKNKSSHPSDLTYSVECYFNRAIRFAPDDGIVRVIYSIFLSHNNRIQEASVQLEEASALAKDNAMSHINIGLAYFDMKEYDKALAQAHIATALGTHPGALQTQLEKVGKWQAPPTPTETPGSSAKPAENALPQKPTTLP